MVPADNLVKPREILLEVTGVAALRDDGVAAVVVLVASVELVPHSKNVLARIPTSSAPFSVALVLVILVAASVVAFTVSSSDKLNEGSLKPNVPSVWRRA